MSKEFETWIAERGRVTELARALGITKGAVSHWDNVPLERVVAVSEYTGIAKAKLRPDVFADSEAA